MIFEPFRIKSVEPIFISSVQERKKFLEEAGYNLFNLKSEQIIIDLLTDSGTSAMSAAQWGALMVGDESYAGSPSFARFENAVKNLMPFNFVLPTHQGRAAEKILFSVFGGKGKMIPNNTHFDTTRANIEYTGAQALDLVIKEGLDPELEYPFKGNMDTVRLRNLIKEHGANVPICMLTITNNSGGGQPVSLANIQEVSQICKEHKIPFFIDACRFAENAWFIKERESGYSSYSIPDIIRKIFSYADGCTMSAKKDALANIGGWLALNDSANAETFKNLLILMEGFPTYGGLAGRDLEAIAVGLSEVVQEDYLTHRIKILAHMGESLKADNVPFLTPVGGHALYLNAKKFLPHIPSSQYPGQSLACELYIRGGIRTCEIGSVMFGKQPDGSEKPSAMELVRLAVPRRVYSNAHLEYVTKIIKECAQHRDSLKGMKIVQQPQWLRHFTARFEYL